MRSSIVFVTLALVLCAGPARAATFSEKADGDQVDPVSNDDPAMAEAVAAARRTFPQFLETAKHPPAGASRFAVKIGLGAKGNQEFFWISPFSIEGDRLVGTLANEPEHVRGVAKGDVVTVPLAEITDWMYVEGGRMRGNYSACALLTHEPPEARAEFAQRYGLDCSGR